MAQSPYSDTAPTLETIAALERRLCRLEDTEAIRRAVYSYAHGTDRCDRPLIAAAYHADARDDHGNFSGGRDDVADRIAANRVQALNSQHHIGNILIELDGDAETGVHVGAEATTGTEAETDADGYANVESYFIACLVKEDASGTFTRLRAGRYLDRFAKRSGEWKIVARQVVEDCSRLDRVQAVPPEVGPGSGCRAGRRDRTDPSYELSDFGSSELT